MNLIPASHAARMSRRDDKRRKLLAFLRTEIWTSVPTAANVMGLATLAPTVRTIKSFARDGLVMLDEVATLRRPVRLIGITAEGQVLAAGLIDKQYIEQAYERGRVGLTTLEHRIDLQQLRIACARASWSGWVYPDRVAAATKISTADVHRPDAIATTPSGRRVAIEVERTIKTRKRYRFIIGRHLEAIARGDYQSVIYTSSGDARAAALRSIFIGLGHVVVAGRDVPVDNDLFSPFRFCSYDNLTKQEV